MSLDRTAAAQAVAAVAAEAGLFLAGISDRGAGRVIKPDGTPTTAADLDAERLIVARLAAIFPDIPVVAEETCRDAIGAAGGCFFLVDPLDGTRDFLTGAGEYSVNIALIEAGRPVAAGLACPPLDRVWAACDSARSTALASAGRPVDEWRMVATRAGPADGLVALVSRRHGDQATERCLGTLPIAVRREVSSAGKFGLVASGDADVYVRCGPTMEWDTAAGDHIVACAGGAVVGPDGQSLRYGEPSRGFLNGPFAAFGDRSLVGKVQLPAG